MSDMFSDLEQLHREDRLWEMATPGGAAVGGKSKRKIDQRPGTRTWAQYEQANGLQQQAAMPQGDRSMFTVGRPHIPIFGPNEQMAIAQGSLNRAMDDHRRENDSRVSQNREMRRMAHEQELMRIKTQGDMARAAADRDAMLIRELLSGM